MNEENFNEYDELLKRLDAGNSEKEVYNFNWNEPELLNYADDTSLEIAYRLIEKGEMALKEVDGETIKIISKAISFCNNNMTNEEFLKKCDENENYIIDSGGSWERDKNKPFNVVGCNECKYQSCPKHLAVYILYLKNKGLLKEKLEARKKFRENNNVNNGFFMFEWKNENGLKKINDEAFNFANELVDRGFLKVNRYLDSSGNIKTKEVFRCKDVQLSDFDIEKFSCEGNWKNTVGLSRKVTAEADGLCSEYSCRMSACASLVGAYIYYLKKSGQEYKIKEDRDYYAAHKEEIDKEIEERSKKKIESINAKKEEKLQGIKESYEGKIENLNYTLNSILESDKTNFHCIVTGDDEEEKDKFIDKIIELLNNNNNNNLVNVRKMSATDLARLNYHTTSIRINSKEKLVYSDREVEEKATYKRDINGITYDGGWKVRRRNVLESNAIYVLDNIEEFVRDYHEYKNSYSDSKFMENAINLLTDMSSNRYVILKLKNDEIDPFIALDSRLKFVYQNNIISLPTYSIDDMYNNYLKTLNVDVLGILKEDEEKYKKAFNEYVSLNKKFMPFNKKEIVNYMATYANTRNEMVFPPNIYKKENLDNIIGLEEVKEKLKEFEKYMLFQIQARANEIGIGATNMHMIFTGNPGTGKTTVARIMAKMLFDLGIIKENKLVEVERKDLIAKYIGQTAIKTAEAIDSAMGGVLFVDEAYSLAQGSTNDYGAEAIATLIKAMEDHKDNLVVIFAGYRNEMKKFTDMNPGIASRIGYTFDFPDYTVDELMQIYYTKLTKSGFEYEEDIDVPLKRVCEYFSKRKNFGNGRFIDKVIQETLLNHALNGSENIKLILKSEIPTIEELNQNEYKSKSNSKTADEMLSELIGMENIKKELLKFKEYAAFVKRAESEKMDMPNVNFHMIFNGNPGTGKTTIARIIAKLLFEMEVIHENKVVEVERKDLIAKYIGQTAIKTAEVIDLAMGGVLFIDEAYSLTQSDSEKDFGPEAIATLIKAMEDHKGELVVIFAGYKNEMKNFVDSNPGIASRIGYTFDFEDYSVEELIEIFNVKMKSYGFELDSAIYTLLKRNCEYYSKRKNYGNGRFIDRVIQSTLTKHALRKPENIRLITEEDVPTIEELNMNTSKNSESVDELLASVVGMTALKEKIKSFENYILFSKKAEKEKLKIPETNMHMIFNGNPGTGKTMMARIIAKMLFDMEVIHENKLVEVERKDLIGSHVGETAIKTNEVIERAMGGVLFIDEAYSLAPDKRYGDSFAEEAIATLIKAMEDHKGSLVVIFAGYKNEMKDFVDANPGIASRIGYTFDFEDYSVEELMEIFNVKMKSYGFELDASIDVPLRRCCSYYSKRKNFGNGRFIDKVIQNTLTKHSMSNDMNNISLITENDIPTIEELNMNTNKNSNDIDSLLANVVGMTTLKEEIKSFGNYISFVKKAEKLKLKIPDSNMHMIFTGNPGTGKTMIARIIAKMLFDLEIIHENKLVEVERKDLVAGYVGQTAIKTNEVIERAMGGVLFIDEAYTLSMDKGSSHGFGEEAIATLIKAMEDHKGEFVVIFAGYKDEMRDFIDTNPGIASRVGYTFNFEDYSPDELTEIFEKKVFASGMKIEDGVLSDVRDLMKYFYRVENIGNGRFVDKVFTKTLFNHSKNSMKYDDLNESVDEILTIKRDEIPTIQDITKIMLDGEEMIDPSNINEKAMRKTAIHEIGHATVGYLLLNNVGIKKITCTAEGWGALGYVQYDKVAGSYTRSKVTLCNLIKRSLAGIAAEEVFIGYYENGGSNDLEKATNIARGMITTFGMSSLGLAHIYNRNTELEKTIYEEENKILSQCFEEVKVLIGENKEKMERAVDYLLEKGEITEEEFIRVFEGNHC